MSQLPEKLQKKIEQRTTENALRSLCTPLHMIDFSSNDYLGLSTSEEIFKAAARVLKTYGLERNGATGSRLLTGNHELYAMAETTMAQFHDAPAALMFNSGYDANMGFFSSVPQRGDLIFYDERCHASIRDGIQMSLARTYKFRHNDLDDLAVLAARHDPATASNTKKQIEVYVVTESVFSMDGDSPDLKALAHFCRVHNYHLVVDEAHAVGVFGRRGAGLVQELGLTSQVFARIVTFGKALGAHGAAILGSDPLRIYLLNFARSFVYTTALPPAAVATVYAVYSYLSEENKRSQQVHRNIEILQYWIKELSLVPYFIPSCSAIHSCVLPGNDLVRSISEKLAETGFDVKPILSPTVPKGQERLRICLHSFNSEVEIQSLLQLLQQCIINERIAQH